MKSIGRLALIAAVAIAVVAAGGCAKPKTRYGDAGSVETVTNQFGSTDLQMLAEQMTQSMLQAPAIESNNLPIVTIQEVKNKTSEYIDTRAITNRMRSTLQKSRRVRFAVDNAEMQKQIEELKRKADQGSQQLQGEVQELELEDLLEARFPLDEITPVPKGEFGGDVLQAVRGPAGEACGTILWETKRTRNWSDGWLAKLRADQRAARADIAVLVSQALPREVDGFGLVDQVWVVAPRLAFPVAMTLRESLIEIARARQASQGLQTKTELVYQYLTGPRFRQRIQGIVEAFDTLRSDLEAERKLLTRQWAKREAQIDRVMQGTLGMYGDLQGIAGQGLQAIEGLEVQALEDGSAKAIGDRAGDTGE